ncbi:hypothetical protein CVS40_2013 [Lucilia cuprina]|nr:hypothetical protein CVS40_2013 [Lucilia cuprina]
MDAISTLNGLYPQNDKKNFPYNYEGALLEEDIIEFLQNIIDYPALSKDFSNWIFTNCHKFLQAYFDDHFKV